FLDDVPVDKVSAFEAALLGFMESNHPEIGRAIEEQKTLTDELREQLIAAIREFKQTMPY
ncbi:MAG TPA: F0F1 ATP synthase subunit alpha, partial [Dehalococcoidia bacterium]|nr:F0F1 ATP synthase subunit alpha [Dehalococcoidia bacterium]